MWERKKYKTETLICAFEYLALSWSAWSRMQEDYELPSITTLKVHQCRFENLPISLSSYENNML